MQDKQVKEAKSKCRTIASLLTDAPNPHSKGVLMFKKRRQRSKKYTLTSFGSVDEDRCQDSQEEDGIIPGSESEFDEEGFSSVPDPTWDSDYLDKLEKRATAGVEGRGDGAEDAPSPGLSDTAGKGAQLFEQQRKRVDELAKKVEAAQPQVSTESQVQDNSQIYSLHCEMHTQVQPNQKPQESPSGLTFTQPQFQADVAHAVPYGDHFTISTANIMMSPLMAPKPATATVNVLSSPAQSAETPLPDLPASNVQNRTARPFTPGFISIRAATAPVTFRPPVTKKSQRPSSAAVVPPPFSTPSEISYNPAPVTSQLPYVPAPVLSTPYPITQGSLALTPEVPVNNLLPAISSSKDTMQSSLAISGFHQAPFSTVTPMSIPSAPRPPQVQVAPVPNSTSVQIPGSTDLMASMPPQMPAAQPQPPQFSMPPVAQVPVISQPEAVAPTPVPGPTGRTGILNEARRRSGKPKPMFIIPEVKKNSPNPDLLSMVQNLDDRSIRHKYGQPPTEVIYDDTEEERIGEVDIGRVPPPVAPKPRVTHETPQILQAGGKGAELFAKRQSRMGMYVVDTPHETPYQQSVTLQNAAHLHDSSVGTPLPSQWKYSPNVRAPPPIGYNPLLAPSIPSGPQRDPKQNKKGSGNFQKEGIKAVDFMKRQPYQLNSAMFQYGGSVANLSAMPSYQAQQDNYSTRMVGNSLTSPRQIPLKTARVYEIKRFSTPTPMSGPSLTPKVIAPRSATTLGERLTDSSMTSPPHALFNPTPVTPAPVTVSSSFQPAGLPSLPKFSATPVPHPVPPSVPTPYTPVSYTTGLQTAKQFQSAPELSILASLPPLKTNPVQAPKPHFVATKGRVQPQVWRPGAF